MTGRADPGAGGEGALSGAGAVPKFANLFSNHQNWLWIALIAGLAIGTRALLAFDPQLGVRLPTPGVEGLFFEPSGESPRLILALASWMLWNRRGTFAESARGGGAVWAGSALLALASGLAAWAHLAAAPDLLLPVLQLLLCGTGVFFGGAAGLAAVRRPALLLLLAIPIPPPLLNELLFALQLFTAQTSAAILELAAVPAIAQGDQVLTRFGVFHVIETCSGLRLIQTMLMAAVVYGELFGRSRARIGLLLLGAIAIAVAVNQARVLSIIANPFSAISSVHTTQGVLMVVIGVLLLAGWDVFLERLRATPHPAPRPKTAMPGDIRLCAPLAVVVATVAISMAAPVWQPAVDPNQGSVHALPREILGLPSETLMADATFFGRVLFSALVVRDYGLRDRAHDGSQDGAENGPPTGAAPIRVMFGESDRLNRRGSLLSPKTAYPGPSWQLRARSSAMLATGTLAERPVEVLLFRSLDQHRLVIHWREGFGGALAEGLRSLSAVDRTPRLRIAPGRTWHVAADVDSEFEIPAVRERLLEFSAAARAAWQAENEARRSPGQ